MKQSFKLRLLRHSAGLDQHQAAEKLNISVEDFSRIETGLAIPDGPDFENLLALFGLERRQFEARPQKEWLALSEALLAV